MQWSIRVKISASLTKLSERNFFQRGRRNKKKKKMCKNVLTMENLKRTLVLYIIFMAWIFELPFFFRSNKINNEKNGIATDVKKALTTTIIRLHSRRSIPFELTCKVRANYSHNFSFLQTFRDARRTFIIVRQVPGGRGE